MNTIRWIYMLLLGFLLISTGGCLQSESESDGDGGPTPCASAGDCNQAAGEICKDGYCAFPAEDPRECYEDSECPAGHYCYTATGTCIEFGAQPPDGDGNTSCPANRQCQVGQDCVDLGWIGYVCQGGCCEDPGADGDTTDGDTDGDDPDGDGPDGDTPDGDAPDGDLPDDCTVSGCPNLYDCNMSSKQCDPSSEHCTNAGCNERYECHTATGICDPSALHCTNAGCENLFECNTETGLCVPASGNCVVDGCPNRYECNTGSGECEPDATHCLTLGCDNRYVCNEQSGLCEPGNEHCSVSGCSPRYDCNTATGECQAAADHCLNAGCNALYSCNYESGLCEPAAGHCSLEGCGSSYVCNTSSGQCEPGPGHCSNTGCTGGFECNTTTGRCTPPVSSCTGSCSGNPDQYCLGDSAFLCACDGSSLFIRDCEEYCADQGYPYLDDPPCYYYTDSNTPSNSRYRCDCDNYGMLEGSCLTPIPITSFPYHHTWDMIGAGNSLSPNGCQLTNPGVWPTDGAERVYSLQVQAGETYQFETETEFLFDPYITVRDQCGLSFNTCTLGSGSVFGAQDERFSVTFATSGTWYVSVEIPAGLVPGIYDLYVRKL